MKRFILVVLPAILLLSGFGSCQNQCEQAFRLKDEINMLDGEVRQAIQSPERLDTLCKTFETEWQNKKIIEAIQKSLFMVLPFENYENLPNAVLESFSCGKAVIATRLGTIPDVVKEGEYGLLYDYGNIAEFSRKLEWLIQNEAARKEMGQKAFAALCRKYSEKQHLEKLLTLFESVKESPAVPA